MMYKNPSIIHPIYFSNINKAFVKDQNNANEF